MEPQSRFFYSQRLKLHYVVWGDEANPPLLLIHGGLDHARSWDPVARALIDRYAVYALDLRGHGDSQWAIGSQYSLPDFVLDVATLGDVLNRRPLTLIGHSMGGAIALQYAGVYPEGMAKVVAIEGLGPGVVEQRLAHVRMRQWIDGMHSLEQRRPHRYASLEDAAARMRQANPRLTAEMARHLALHGTLRNEDGSLSWKFDNYVRIRSPYGFNMEDARAIWNQIPCPVLLVRGQESWASDPEKDSRASAFRDYRAVAVPDAGHWVHHDQLDRFLAVVEEFLAAEG